MFQLKTPKYEKSPDFYEPAEDSFLLLDAIQALENEENFFSKHPPAVVLDIGCGSGVLLQGLIQSFSNSCLFIGMDRNPEATLGTARLCPQADVWRLNFQQWRPPKPVADFIIFNPPYVPSPDFEKLEEIDHAWAGLGPHGDQVILEFVQQVKSWLTPEGTLFLLVEKKNRMPLILEEAKQHGLFCVPFMVRQARNETLTILRCKRI